MAWFRRTAETGPADDNPDQTGQPEPIPLTPAQHITLEAGQFWREEFRQQAVAAAAETPAEGEAGEDGSADPPDLSQALRSPEFQAAVSRLEPEQSERLRQMLEDFRRGRSEINVLEAHIARARTDAGQAEIDSLLQEQARLAEALRPVDERQQQSWVKRLFTSRQAEAAVAASDGSVDQARVKLAHVNARLQRLSDAPAKLRQARAQLDRTHAGILHTFAPVHAVFAQAREQVRDKAFSSRPRTVVDQRGASQLEGKLTAGIRAAIDREIDAQFSNLRGLDLENYDEKYSNYFERRELDLFKRLPTLVAEKIGRYPALLAIDGRARSPEWAAAYYLRRVLSRYESDPIRHRILTNLRTQVDTLLNGN